jgi:long-subunit fatty acid transport protein
VVAVGFGVFSYFGSALDYDDDFVGRYKIDETALIGFTFMPAVSVQLADWVSLGAGFNMMLGLYNYELAVDREYQDTWHLALGARWRPIEPLALSLPSSQFTEG